MTDGPSFERDGDHLIVRVPMKFKKRGGRKEIIVPEGISGSRTSKSPVQEPLVTALARAFHWQELIDSGNYSSITELSKALDIDRSYVGRIMRLALLAPDIVEAIVLGEEPIGLSLEKLTKWLPVIWEEQREKFGFSQS